MITFAFDYLKANPQIRDRLVKHEWSSLFVDPEVPYSIKQELKEIQLMSVELSDAVLFWHRWIKVLNLTEDATPHYNRRGRRIQVQPIEMSVNMWRSHWLDQAYTYIQLTDIDDLKTQVVFCMLLSIREHCLHIRLTQKEFEQFIIAFQNMIVASSMSNVYAKTVKVSEVVSTVVNNNLVYALLLNVFTLGRTKYTPHSGRNLNKLEYLYRFCSQDFLRTIQSQEQAERVAELLMDVDHDSIERPFESINEIQRAHDARTELETKKLLEEKGDYMFIYHNTFEEIVKRFGFLLPSGPNTLVIRGQQHHNCVATYSEKHTREAPHNAGVVSRVILSREATLELSFDISFGKIVSTNILQYKGAYNKNLDVTLPLVDMRIALTGQEASVLNIKQVRLTPEIKEPVNEIKPSYTV